MSSDYLLLGNAQVFLLGHETPQDISWCGTVDPLKDILIP